jgi:hypothetical protein
MKMRIVQAGIIGYFAWIAASAHAVQLDLRESFDGGNADWGAAYYKDSESLEYEALWLEEEEAIWDAFETPEWVELYLFADEISSGGAYVGDYIDAGVGWIIFDVSIFGTSNITDFSTYMITEDGAWFEYAWNLPLDMEWGSYLTPLQGEFWYRLDPDLNQWILESPTEADWRSVAEIGISIRTVDTPGAWDVIFDDFRLVSAQPAPDATVGFIEDFPRSYSLWLEDRLSNTSGDAWDASWNFLEGALIADFVAGQADTVWLFADAFSSYAKFTGDYTAEGVESIDFEFSAINPNALAYWGTYFITESGREFEFPLDIPADDGWYLYSIPVDGDGWFRYDHDEDEWLEETPLPSDWAEVAEVGIVLESNGGEATVFLDNVGLTGNGGPAAPPELTAFYAVADDRVHLDWVSEGPVLIEHSGMLTNPQWQVVGGPLTGSSAEIDLPAAEGFFRLLNAE